MSIGCYIGGALLPRFGSRRLIIASNFIGLLFTILKLIENSGSILIGRLFTGVTLGIACVCLSKAINDTVPAKNAPVYGAFVNAGFGIGIFLSNLLGLMIPINDEKEGAI